MGNYRYTELSQTRQQLRIFTLLPSTNFDSLLRGRLRAVELDTNLAYKALSYVWGTKPELLPLLKIDGMFCNIGAHLANILKHLRHPEREQDLWIDAICIDQHNNFERGCQVPLMRDIYRNCETDLVWLENPPDEQISIESEEYVDSDDEEDKDGLPKNLVQNWKTFDQWWRQLPYGGQDEDSGKLDDEDYHSDDYEAGEDEYGWPSSGSFESGARSRATIEQGLAFIKSRVRRGITLQDFGGHYVSPSARAKLKAVFNTRLWSRIWIVQELACAKEVVLLGGKKTLKWRTLSKFLVRPCSSDRYHSLWGRGIIETGLAKIFFRAAEIDMQRVMVNSRQGEISTLFDVLAKFSDRESTDTRDRVYGLLGLVSPHLSLPKVDYTDTNTPAKVFVEATKQIISHGQNLDILCQSPWERLGVPQPSRLGHFTKGLPSWAIDFAAPRLFQNAGGEFRSREILFAGRGIFSAGGDFGENGWQVLDGNNLKLRGFLFGRIGSSQPQPPEQAWEFKADVWGDDIIKGIYEPTGEPKNQALWRTFVTDCKGYPMERLVQESIKADNDRFESLDGEYTSDFICKKMWQRIKHNWVYYVSEDGLFVMARKHVEEGDYIAIVEGAKVPLILHSVGDDRFEIVSPAYVHGWMDKDSPLRGVRPQTRDLLII